VWAPAVVKGKNNKYYLYCQSSVDYTVYVGDTPTGPFKKINQLKGFDLEPFTDLVSSKIYVVSASQEIFEMDNDPASPTYLTKIARRLSVKGRFDFTEGPYLFYRKGLYYLMWAGGRCWQKSYNGRYATAKSLEGPYVDAPAPLLQNDEVHGVLGPGHNSMLEAGGRTFLLYHRQDVERAPTYGFPCASEVAFNPDALCATSTTWAKRWA
jgi:beta-xylosidase